MQSRAHIPGAGVGVGPFAAALAGLVIFNVVLSASYQDALFLMNHPRERIPLAMLLGSLLTAIVTITANGLLRGRPLVTVLRVLLGALSVAAAGAAVWNQRPSRASTFALFLFVEAAGTLGAATTWSYFQAPLELPQIRRVLPRLGIYAGLGGFAASLAIRLLLRHAAPQALIWLSALSWLGAALLVRDVPAPARARPRPAPPSRLADITRLPLARWMVVAAAAVIWLGLVVQYELRVSLQQHLTPPAIARTMGQLLGAAALGGVLTQAFVTPFVLERSGVGLGLSLLPGALALCLGGFLIAPYLAAPHLAAAPLGLIIAAALLDRILRPNLHRSAESCLVGALPPALRPSLVLTLGGIAAPLLKALGALALWGTAAVGLQGLATAGLVLALGLVLLGTHWGKVYTRSLRETLAEGSVEMPRHTLGGAGLLALPLALPLIDGPRLALLLEAIDHGSRRARALALELLMPHRAAMVARAMAARILSPREPVRIAALRWHAAEPAAMLRPELRSRWQEPSLSPAERVALLEAAGPAAPLLLGHDAERWLALPAGGETAAPQAPATSSRSITRGTRGTRDTRDTRDTRAARGPRNTREPSSLRAVVAQLQARGDRELRAAVAAALHRSSERSHRELGRRGLAALLAAPLPEERALALSTIGRSGAGELLPEVLRGLADRELLVRREAVATLSAFAVAPDARAALWAALDDPALAAAAVRAFAACGEAILPEVLAALAAEALPLPPPRRALLLRGLGLIPARHIVHTVPVLLAELDRADRGLHLEALRALNKLHRLDPALPLDVPRLHAVVLADLRRGLQLQAHREALGTPGRRRGLLRRQLDAEIEDAQERVSRALALLSPPDTMVHVFRSLRSPSSPHRDQARELLRTLFPDGPLGAGAAKLLDESLPWPESCYHAPLEIVPPATAEEAVRRLVHMAETESALWSALCHDPELPRPPDLHLNPAPEDPMTASVETVLFLKDVALFEALTNAELLAVARLAEKLELPDGGQLFHQGEAPDYLYIVCEGKLRVVVNDREEVAHLGPGECVGEMAVLAGGERSATVTALGPARLLRFDGDSFLGLLEVYPEIARALLRSLVRRLSHAARPSEGLLSTLDGMIRTGLADR